MPKFTVYLMKPVVAWEGVEADGEEDAITQCGNMPELDICTDGEPTHLLAVQETTEEDD